MEDLIEAYLSVYEESDIDEGYEELPVDKMMAKSKSITKRQRKPGEPRWTKDDQRASDIRKTAGTHSRAKVKKIEQANRARGSQTESADLYDLVLDHLLDEGYAETEDNAISIMANMSEEWKQSIVEYYVTEANRADDYVTSSMFMSREPETKNAKERRRRMRDGLSAQDDNLRQFAHTLSRGVKRGRGKKPLDEPGRDRYSTMQDNKKQAQRERDADEQRTRDRGGMSRGTWDKG